MPTLDVNVTVFDGVKDTIAADFARATKVFMALPIAFKVTKFTLNRAQSRAILGGDNKLAIAGGPTKFDRTLPGGRGTVTVEDPKGRFSKEVWAAMNDWTNLGGLRVYYVPALVGLTAEGGLTLEAGDLFDPIVLVGQDSNQSLLTQSKGMCGVLEHEVGHALGLQHNASAKALMFEANREANDLTPDDLKRLKTARLLAPTKPGAATAP
jgi:Matrixin